MNTDDFFPIVLLPSNYKILLEREPSPPIRPQKPDSDILPSAPPKKRSTKEDVIGYRGLIILFIMATFSWSMTIKEGKGDLVIPSLILTIISIGGMYFRYTLDTNYVKEYPNKLKEYNLQKKNYYSFINSFNNERKEYANKLKIYELAKDKVYSKEELRIWRLQEMKNFRDIDTYSTDDAHLIQKGKTENFFLNKLKSNFGELIHTNIKMGYYYPDFIYKEGNIIIDIEIDEPYESINLQPIHYKGADNKRNEYFVQQNCVVIRFSEEQIVKYSDACCKFIELFIEHYKNLIHLDKQSLLTQSELPAVKGWSRDEAIFLAGSNYRNSY